MSEKQKELLITFNKRRMRYGWVMTDYRNVCKSGYRFWSLKSAENKAYLVADELYNCYTYHCVYNGLKKAHKWDPKKLNWGSTKSEEK
jgi:hypothetical protein